VAELSVALFLAAACLTPPVWHAPADRADQLLAASERQGQPQRHVLLSGIVGSTAYGLAHSGSDVDRLGIFAEATEALHGLRAPRESHVGTTPDVTHHEARKALQLMLSSNPTVMEILWLPDELYEIRTPLGEEPLSIRSAFLSERGVRSAYLGYASHQFRKLKARGDGTFSSDVRNRSLKHARHLCRLVEMGVELHRTGALTIRVADPESIRSTAERIVANPDVGERLIAVAEEAFDKPGVLPEQPDEAAAEAWLRRVRAAFYEREAA
jgi:hypothetical protein